MFLGAVAGRARVIITPEVTNCISVSRAHQKQVLRPESEDATLAFSTEFAKAHGVWIILGSLALKPGGDEHRFVNRQFIIGPDGAVRSRYDKIHMFDVRLSETESYQESAGYAPGDQMVCTDVDGTVFGSTICYDLRFPHLFRDLAQQGSAVIVVPSAFAVPTGEAHWHMLLRARAIETGCFIVAPAQTGLHVGRETYGHSLVVDPWGRVMLDAGTQPGVFFAELDLDDVAEARQKIPSLHGDRHYMTSP